MAAAVPALISAGVGMLGQNMSNKANAASAQSAQNNAAAQTSLHQQQAMHGLQRFLQQNPNPASTWGGLNVPASIGGGVTTGGVNPMGAAGGPPQGGYNPMIAQILQQMLSGGSGGPQTQMPTAGGPPQTQMPTAGGMPPIMTGQPQFPQTGFGPAPGAAGRQVPSAILRMGQPGGGMGGVQANGPAEQYRPR